MLLLCHVAALNAAIAPDVQGAITWPCVVLLLLLYLFIF